ncbi:MAG TPA: TetR/AcrR family transcriptional regulator [Chthoniobacterales bacterium]|jgi:AcrR family transcriptional regulator|nr:TetR/AcrR family transcriptional regulator [Chthoniobacterales bacterium]
MSNISVTNVRKKSVSPRKPKAALPNQSPITNRQSHSGRGRPREFDQEKALDQALELFWRQGYEGTSIADLRKVIGITAPSLYAAFGSKEDLYRQVLEHYLAGLGRTLADALRKEANTYAAVKRFLFESAQKFAGPKTPRGCLISCAIPTCAPENRAVADVVAAKRITSVEILRSRFQQAVKNGELPRDTDTEQLARFYGAVIQGMSIQALDGASVKALRGIAETALRAWPGGTRPKLVPQ